MTHELYIDRRHADNFVVYDRLGRRATIAVYWTGRPRDQSTLAEEVQAYLSGEGMGFAKAAELNHYPGPRHVLDLADKLQLSSEQRGKTQAIFNRMKSEAVDLGKQVVEKEALLDSRFAGGTISEAELKQLLAEIADLQGKLRATHLRAHLAQRQV